MNIKYKMSFDSYLGTFDENLPPHSWYNYQHYIDKDATYDRDRFESYLEEPTFDFPPESQTVAEYIDFQEVDEKYFCFEEWNTGRNYFWSKWVANELEINPDKAENDGLIPFGNNLIWMNHRLAKGLDKDKMYIAYTMRKTDNDIIIATCVFVQQGGVYSTLGITKSKKYNNSYSGSAYELQKYIAHVVREKLDPLTMGLLFRPNSLMRGIMYKKLAKETLYIHRRDNIKIMYIGSDWDMDWAFEHFGDRRSCDMASSIIQDNDGGGIIIRHLGVDENGNYVDKGWLPKIPTPFWEAPAPYCNPNGPNNPQTPLVFFPIVVLLPPYTPCPAGPSAQQKAC